MGLGLAAIGFFNDNPGLVLAGFSARAFQLAICGVMLGLGAVMILLWRCPACKTFLGLMRLPVQCPRCGAVLRNQELRR
jgi:rubrerythrin